MSSEPKRIDPSTPVRGQGGSATHGALIVFLAGIAMLAPLAPPWVASILFASVLLVAGMLGIVSSLRTGAAQGIWRMAWIGLATGTGGLVLYHHFTGVGSLPWILGLGAALMGLSQLPRAWTRRPRDRAGWGWLALSVLVVLGFGLGLVRSSPHPGMMLLAGFLALNLAAFGLSLMATALAQWLGARWL
jgi:uncharacterized membrane protein HdeD (DUF308 family)